MTIQGSVDCITLLPSIQSLSIGCKLKSIKEWLQCYQSIGKNEGYSPAEIAEYGMHIKHAAVILQLQEASQ